MPDPGWLTMAAIGEGAHMRAESRVLVYGATGHTGQFVATELARRGLVPVLAARSVERLATLPERYARFEKRAASTGSGQLKRALSDVRAVVNCAGPFVDTAAPLAEAALSAGVHYLDITAEQRVAQHLYARFHEPAQLADVAVIPAMAFFGGMADLLVTSALDGAEEADEVAVAVGLDRWWPTEGTRATGARNTAPRQVIRRGRMAPLEDDAGARPWSFPEPLGEQVLMPLPLAEVVTIGRHLRVGELTSYMNSAPLDDLHDASTPPPTPVDEDGRSSQSFVVEVLVRCGGEERRSRARGQDIYAITAPLVVEGVVRLLDGRHSGPGALAPGQAFDAADVLASLPISR